MTQSGLSRRALLGGLGGVLGAGALARAGLAGAAPATLTETVQAKQLGVQLWTCLASWETNGPETLALIAQTGYHFVEYAFGYGSAVMSDPASGRIGMTPKAFRKALDDSGLWCIGGHGTSAYPYNDKAWKTYVEDNLIIGARGLGANITLPSTRDGVKRYVEDVHKAHEVARRMGFTGSQYNHLESAAWNRLSDVPGVYAWEYAAQHLPRDVWNPELDIDHAYQPLGSIGQVLRYIRKYPGRWSLFHMKDGEPNVYLPDGTWEQGAPAEFGTGVFGLPDPADPKNRPHAGFQDVLTAIRETQIWSKVLIIAEDDTSLPTCFDEAKLAADGLKDLPYTYSVDYERTLDPTDPDYPKS